MLLAKVTEIWTAAPAPLHLTLVRIFQSAVCFALLPGFGTGRHRSWVGKFLITLSSTWLLTWFSRIVRLVVCTRSVNLPSRSPSSTVCLASCVPAPSVCITVSAKAGRGRLINSPHWFYVSRDECITPQHWTGVLTEALPRYSLWPFCYITENGSDNDDRLRVTSLWKVL